MFGSGFKRRTKAVKLLTIDQPGTTHVKSVRAISLNPVKNPAIISNHAANTNRVNTFISHS